MKIVKNVLLLGNAFVLENDLRGRLQALSASLSVGVCASPDMTLEDHVTASASCLSYTDWDVVVLQEDNRVSMDRNWVQRSTVPAIHDIAAQARMRNAHARVILFQPWTFRDGYGTYSADDMHAALLHAYVHMAAVGAEVSFVGTAVRAMQENAGESLRDKALWADDGRTPKKLLSEIAALVLFKTITGKLPVNLPIEQEIPLWVDDMM